MIVVFPRPKRVAINIPPEDVSIISAIFSEVIFLGILPNILLATRDSKLKGASGLRRCNSPFHQFKIIIKGTITAKISQPIGLSNSIKVNPDIIAITLSILIKVKNGLNPFIKRDFLALICP